MVTVRHRTGGRIYEPAGAWIYFRQYRLHPQRPLHDAREASVSREPERAPSTIFLATVSACGWRSAFPYQFQPASWWPWLYPWVGRGWVWVWVIILLCNPAPTLQSPSTTVSGVNDKAALVRPFWLTAAPRSAPCRSWVDTACAMTRPVRWGKTRRVPHPRIPVRDS